MEKAAAFLEGSVVLVLGQLEAKRFAHVTDDLSKSFPTKVAAVLGGETQLAIESPPPIVPQVKAGKLRALGVSSLQRLSALQEVPTIDEAGLKGFEGSSWYGFVAPTGTPVAVIEQLNGEIVRLLKTQEFVSRFAAEGAIPVGNTPQQFGTDIRREIDKWTKVIRDAGIKPE